MVKAYLVKRVIGYSIVGILAVVVAVWCNFALSYNYPKLGRETYCKPSMTVQLVNATRQLFSQPTGEIYISNNQNNTNFLNAPCK
jgi:hypothetical protein